MEFITRIYGDEYKCVVVQAIRNICYDINESDLDDCVSDVYLTAIGTSGLIEHPDIKGWLYSVARNVAKRHRKRLSFLKVKQFNETAVVEAASKIDIAVLFEDRLCGENSELLALLQKNLKVSEYTLFKMKYLDGKLNDEIADFIGIKKHSVDVKITRLHEKIRVILQGTKHEREIVSSKLKRCATLLTIIVVATLLLQGVAMALGYDNILDLIRSALNTPEETVLDLNNNDSEMVFTSGTKTYKSMQEMLEAENLNILFPATLPDGYHFTHFETVYSDGNLNIIASATEPYIHFIVLIETSITIDSYSHEMNGVEFNIIERDGLFQAQWVFGTDYYMVAVANETTLLEIIEKLAGE